jgi:hypothetical protein
MWDPDEDGSKEPDKSVTVDRSRTLGRRQYDGIDITVRAKVGYKTILLAVVVIDLVYLLAKKLIESEFPQHIVEGAGF